ncbi:MAG TPA: serine/threonine-protein kinase [Gemmatimonadaceae bacterium]|nr:serine/threonine-protein kinase [Gemmatimonadaceae bacterium]
MSASFQEHLELALGDEFRVVRELGGGGMSRVFLATEVALGRQVVIKVLTPELAAGVNRERFRREVQLAAGLQHPMIVPLLSAGEAEGLLWYTMPFVEGESLRERIQRGAMSCKDALPVLVDVARALGAAHRKGIVHRDIKPGNILLHEQHAVVADFGVAKALTAAVSESTGLTTSGLAVGTPAYMSPEQAAGDGTIDARADIYALGCVAYEMLSGKPPFTDPSAARMLVAQVSQAPVPLHQVAAVKAGMSAVIMRCLEKDPEQRWPTADALAEAFEQQRYSSEATPLPPEPAVAPRTPTQSMATVAAVAARPSRRKRVLGGGAAIAIAVALGLAMSSGNDGPKSLVAFSAPQTVIVADVENRTADSTLGDLLSEALRTELQESKLVTVMTPGATAAALQRMQRPAESRLSSALAREIAMREGVPMVVAGRIQKVGNTYLVRSALLSPSDGAEQSAVQETAASEDELIAAIGRLARSTRRKLGESNTALTALAPMERVTTTSLDALRKYTEALRLGDGVRHKGGPDQEIALLEEAVRLDSTFAMAWRRLGVRLLGGKSDFSNARQLRAEAALTRAYELRDRLSPVERGLAEAAYFTEVERDAARATAAYHAILTEQPANRIALNNLANNAMQEGMFERVREYGARYVAVDSANMQAWPWLLWGAYGTGRVEEARALRAQMRQRFTAPEEIDELDELDLNWLAVERDWPALETLARKRLASPVNFAAGDRALRSLMTSLAMRGLMEESWKANDAVGAARLASRDTTQVRMWRGDSARQRYFDRAWFGGDTTGVQRAIATYRRESNVDSWRMADRPNINLMLDYIVAGDVATARSRFAAYQAASRRENGSGALPTISSPIMRALEGELLVAEGRARDALRLLAPVMADAERIPQKATYVIGTAYAAAGERDSARTWLGRIAYADDPRHAWADAGTRMRALQLLCTVAESAAERQQSCGAIASGWKDADAFLQPIVARARARLQQ